MCLQKHWPTFLSLTVWVYLHSNVCSGLQKTHLFCNRVRFGRLRSSKVNDFGTNRKRACDFLLVHHCKFGLVLSCTVSEIWRLIGSKLFIISYPSLIRRYCCLWNFAVKKLTVRKLRVYSVMELSYSEDPMIVAWVILTQCQRVIDRRMDVFTIASTALCVVSYADAL